MARFVLYREATQEVRVERSPGGPTRGGWIEVMGHRWTCVGIVAAASRQRRRFTSPSPPALADIGPASLPNRALLDAMHQLTTVTDPGERRRVRRAFRSRLNGPAGGQQHGQGHEQDDSGSNALVSDFDSLLSGSYGLVRPRRDCPAAWMRRFISSLDTAVSRLAGRSASFTSCPAWVDSTPTA